MIKDTITIFAPATVSNVGSGFDVLGFALDGLGDTLRLTKRDDTQLVIKEITGADLPTDPDKNVVGVVLNKMFEKLGQRIGFDIEIEKKVMPGSGLGSSGSSSAGAAVALNEFLGRPFDKLELTRFAMEGENYVSSNPHADNVAPCIYGGITLVRSYEPLDIIPIEPGIELWVSVIHPQVEVKTADARRVMGDQVSLADATRQWGNLGGLILGLLRGNLELIGNSMVDVIAEPSRAKLIPYFYEAREVAAGQGAIGFNISGSGPAMFAFAETREKANFISTQTGLVYQEASIPVKTYVSRIRLKGASIV